MRYLPLLLLILSCEANRPITLVEGDCVIGERMDVWKLMQKDNNGKYLFASYPVKKGTPVEIIEDISALKKVECPN